jgi:hypothetical protein
MTGDMKAYRVTVEPRLSRGTDPGRDYRGRCYEMALRYLADHREDEPGLRLVHGTLHIVVGVPYPHAWVEVPGGIVFDPVDQYFYKRRAYYRRYDAAAARVYTPAEAEQLAITTNHWGPWHETTPGSNAAGTADGQVKE